jgi:hypothetical protein
MITGVRFYKSDANSGPHTGSLWTAEGVRLAMATFVGETSSGWQEVTFVTPVAISPGVTYVASYFAPRGAYAVDDETFTSTRGIDRAPLHALPGHNGVYQYGGGFPTQTYRGSNYFVDVTFSPESRGAAEGPPSATPTAKPVPMVGTEAWINQIITTAHGTNEVFPHGVPSDWDWQQGSNGPWPIPASYQAANGYGVVYLAEDEAPDPNVKVNITSMKLWLKGSAGWVLAQSGPDVEGAAFVETFSDNGNLVVPIRSIPDGVQFDAPPAGHNLHYWVRDRGVVPAGFTGDYIVQQVAQLAGSGASSAKYGAATGMDWWVNSWDSGLQGAGQGRMMELSDQPLLIGYTNMTRAALSASHPS